MAKPAITKRTVKGAALTYNELDTNFQNLADATISIDADGTVIALDLNDTVTLTPGTNVTFTVTGNDITINATGGTGITNPLSANLDTASYYLYSSTGNIQVNDDINFPGNSGPFVPGSGTLRCRGGSIKLEFTNDPGLEIQGANISSTPSNTSTVNSWLKVTVNGQIRYIPLYA